MTEIAKPLDRRSFILSGLATAALVSNLQTTGASASTEDSTFEPRIVGASRAFSIKGKLTSMGSSNLVEVFSNNWPNYEANILDLSGRVVRNIAPFDKIDLFAVSGGYAECTWFAFSRYNSNFGHMYSIQYSRLARDGDGLKSNGYPGIQCFEIGFEHFVIVRLSQSSTGRRQITGSIIRNRRVVVRDKVLYSFAGKAAFYLISAGHVGNGRIGVTYFQTDNSSAEGHRYLITFDNLLRRVRGNTRISGKYEYYENGYTQSTFFHPVDANRFIMVQPNFGYGNFIAHVDIILFNQNHQILKRIREVSLNHYYPTVGTIGLSSIDVGGSIIVAFIRDSSSFTRPGTRTNVILKIRKADLKIIQRSRGGLLSHGEKLENITDLERLGTRRFFISYITSSYSITRKARIFFI